jgi:hypothetical protein
MFASLIDDVCRRALLDILTAKVRSVGVGETGCRVLYELLSSLNTRLAIVVSEVSLVKYTFGLYKQKNDNEADTVVNCRLR